MTSEPFEPHPQVPNPFKPNPFKPSPFKPSPFKPNPFKPTAGATPPVLVGRADYLREFNESLIDGPGSPGRLTIYTGARGVGKTVMLTEVSDAALQAGWVTISETATPGLLERLTHATTRILNEIDPATAPSGAITGITLPVIGGGANFARRPKETVQWRQQLGQLLDALEPRGTGLLITIDEVHRHSRDDLRDVAATYQHLVREDRNVALVMAGLPIAISDLLNDHVLTFLRRATREVLEDVPLTQVRAALRSTIESEGRSIDDDALETAATATNGYPFMIQLVGYHVWREGSSVTIDLDTARRGVVVARTKLGSTVHESALADLSDVDRAYLLAMAKDSGPSRTRDVAARMGQDAGYANVYRTRLIDAGLIEPTGHGLVNFTVPYLRDFLRENTERYTAVTRKHDEKQS